VLSIILISIPACTQPQRPIPGFHPRLSISETPALGKPVKLILTGFKPHPSTTLTTTSVPVSRVLLSPEVSIHLI
jgi:hypothetical protein